MAKGTGRLSRMLLGALPPDAAKQAEVVTNLEEALRAMLDTGRAMWPGVALDDAAFIEHLAAHLANEENVAAAIAATRGPDLFLACACTVGDARAMAAFEKNFLRQIGSAVSRMRLESTNVDELAQVVRQKLLIGAAGEPPKIANYAGRGPLESWVRVVAVRAALSLLRKKGGALEGSDEELMNVPAPMSDPEMDLVRARYSKEFEASFRAALSALSAQERNVLRLHFVDSLSIDHIGTVYSVHRSTAARWIQRARDGLLTETRKLLMARLHLTTSEFESLMGVIQSRLDVSIQSFLRGAE